MEEAAVKVSVIVPVYQVKPYLERCVESICRQTLEEIEILLIDDGSTDGGGELCDLLAERDPRIRVVHQENGGLSAARNRGLELARGEYIGFVDSDDFIGPEMYRLLYETCKEKEAEVAVCNFFCETLDGTQEQFHWFDLPGQVLSGREMIGMIDKPEGVLYLVSWNKLYHHRIFCHRRFEKGKQNEDVRIFCELFWEVKRVCCIPDRLYHYRLRPDSIMNKRVSLSHLDEPEAFYQCFQFCLEKGVDDCLPGMERRMFAKLANVYYGLGEEEREDRRVLEVKEQHRTVLRELKAKKRLSGKAFFSAFLFHRFPEVYFHIRQARRKKRRH